MAIAPASATGVYRKSIAIEVPDYRGLEPKLSFTYNSAQSRSISAEDVSGAGWGLSGLSRITRRAKRHGLPRFDNADEFLLDGQRLIPCPDEDKAAGCAAGGTYTTQVENYLRIKRLQETNLWQITRRDGSVLTYKPLATWADYSNSNSTQKKLAEDYRWQLASVTDTIGNTVSYSYECTNLPTCRIKEVSWKTGAVTFNWQDRPDQLTYATGLSLGKVTKRLSSVVVSSAGAHLRAYQINYAQSPATNKSLVASIQEYGRDATIADGVVTGGTSLPAHDFTYSGETPALKTASHTKADRPNGSVLFNASFSSRFNYDDDKQLDHITPNYMNEKCTLLHSDVIDLKIVDEYASCLPFHFYRSLFGIQPFLVLQNSYGSERELVALSLPQGVEGYPDSTYYSHRIGDFDGDGLDDVIGNKAPVKGKFTRSTVEDWSGDDPTFAVGEFNGDGLADLFEVKSNKITIKRSNGENGFVSLVSKSGSYGSKVAVGDLNGDGTTDFLTYHGGSSFKAHYVVGNTLVSSGTISLSGYSDTSDTSLQIADVDGDGRGDIIASRWSKNSSSSTYFRLYLNKGNSSFAYLAGSGSHTVNGSAAAYVGDMDRDGIAELIEWESNELNIYGDQRYYVAADLPDVMISATEPSGVEQKVSYSLYKGEEDNWFPYPRRVVSEIETSDGRGGTSTTGFSYSGGKWDYDHFLFLGFEKSVTTLPKLAGEDEAPEIETTYRQDVSSIGKVAEQIWKDGAGIVLRRQVHEYTAQNDNKPYTSLNTMTLTSTYEEGIERNRKLVREFDAYGQIKRTIDHGDLAKSGDERTYTRWSYPNKGKYIVDRWAVEQLNAGTSYNYAVKRAMRRWHYYDGQGIDTPPSIGLRTLSSQWTGGAEEDKLVLDQNSYDNAGNLVEQKNALGETTSFIYDTQYSLFPEQERSPLYHGGDVRHVVRTNWDKVCGVPVTVTDVKGKVTTHSYDALCRLVRIDYPNGGYQAVSYQNWGNPEAQHIVTTSTPALGNTPVTSREYYDGLGRVWKSEQEVGSGKMLRELTGYNDRGQVSWIKKLHEPGSEPAPESFSYDALGRQLAVNHGDGTSTNYTYLAGPEFHSVQVTDALGNMIRTHFDAHGNEVRRVKVLDGQELTTRMDYDALDQLTKVTDPAGSVWSYVYDGLGNQVLATDPNLGTWTKEYDRANRIVRQTDNKDQVTTYTYDKAGRTKQHMVGVLQPQPDPIMGTSASETLKGSAVADVIHGLAGNDKLYGYEGNDKLYGGEGNDTLYSGSGADLIDGGAGSDVADYSHSPAGVSLNLATGAVSGGDADGDTLNSVEHLAGSPFGDVLIGDDASNALYAGNGVDHLSGGAGNDTLNANGSGADHLDGGSGTDTVRYYHSRSGVTVNLASPDKNAGDAAGDTYTSIEGVQGSDKYNDHLTGNDGANILWGHGGNDTLVGGKGNDRLYGGSDNDTFVFEGTNTGQDVIEDFAAGEGTGDVIRLQHILLSKFSDVLTKATQKNADTLIALDQSNTLTLKKVRKSDLHSDDFDFIPHKFAGIWLYADESGNSKVRIGQCAQQYCGTVVWMENPRNDTENADPALRSRPVVGIQIFDDMTETSATRLEGPVYHPPNGKTYSGSLTVIDDNTLELQSCIIWPLCKTTTLTRSAF